MSTHFYPYASFVHTCGFVVYNYVYKILKFVKYFLLTRLTCPRARAKMSTRFIISTRKVAVDSYAQKIRDLRERKSITQDEAARALGVTRPTYNSIETGKRDMTVTELHALCNLFGATVEQFLFSSTQSEPYESRMVKYKEIILNCLQYGSEPNDSRTAKTTKTKLAALVYMCDFAAYYECKRSLSGGLPYRHMEYGPVVDAYYRMVDELYDDGFITIELRGRAIMIGANEPSAPHSTLDDDEVALIKRVCERWKGDSTHDVTEFVRSQTPWKSYTEGEIIPYNSILADPHNPFFEVPNTAKAAA